MIRPWFRQEWCLLIVVTASSWVDEFIQRYETQGLGLWDELDSDWARRTQEYGIRRPTQNGRIFVYRAFDLWSHTGPFYRATVVVHQVMLPDEILWRIALHWPDLGHDWNRVGWHLVTVDDSRSSSCLPDLISPTCRGFWGIWLTVRMDSWRSPVVMLVMSALQCCPRELISRSCRSCSMPSVDEVGQW